MWLTRPIGVEAYSLFRSVQYYNVGLRRLRERALIWKNKISSNFFLLLASSNGAWKDVWNGLNLYIHHRPFH